MCVVSILVSILTSRKNCANVSLFSRVSWVPKPKQVEQTVYSGRTTAMHRFKSLNKGLQFANSSFFWGGLKHHHGGMSTSYTCNDYYMLPQSASFPWPHWATEKHHNHPSFNKNLPLGVWFVFSACRLEPPKRNQTAMDGSTGMDKRLQRSA